MSSKKITKAVFPVAGFGTRFLPVTKASPKEMLPIVDKPLIQYAVEEAIEAGITDMIFITGRNKRAIEDHFDKAYELESELHIKNKTDLLQSIQNIVPSNINCIYIRQTEMLGLGHAVLCAKAVTQNEPFAVLLADELIDATPGALAQMVKIYEETANSILGVQEVEPSEVSAYGIIKPNDLTSTNPQVIAVVEKPSINQAPSNLAIIGRYILTPQIMTILSNTKRGISGEIQLTDAIATLLKHEPIHAHKVNGIRYDCGSKLGYLKATVAYGLKHKELAQDFADFLHNL
jgi:UTP--glucose-1-phosphate uridylyltransferase